MCHLVTMIHQTVKQYIDTLYKIMCLPCDYDCQNCKQYLDNNYDGIGFYDIFLYKSSAIYHVIWPIM